MIKSTVKSTAESFKSGILKNERNKDITLIFWAYKKGLIVRGQFESAESLKVSIPQYLRSFNNSSSFSATSVKSAPTSVPQDL